MNLELTIGNKKYLAEVKSLNGGIAVVVDGKEYPLDVARCRDGMLSILVKGKSYEVAVEEGDEGRFTLFQKGRNCTVEVVEQARRPGANNSSGLEKKKGKGQLLAPMPGRITDVLVKQGEEVQEKQGLIIIEAMKMQNQLASPRAGRVAEIRVSKGDRVDPGSVLVVIE
jgi:biotin carboxyl carrier protein